MKQILITLAGIATLFYSCKKDNQNQTIPESSLSGSYKLFKIVDTSYNNANIADGLSSVIIETATGDTAYLNAPGSQFYRIEPNPIPNYVASYNLNVVIDFTSPSKGYESDFGESPYGITYSLSTKVFSDGAFAPSSIVQMPNNEIAIYTVDKNNGVIAGSNTEYFSK